MVQAVSSVVIVPRTAPAIAGLSAGDWNTYKDTVDLLVSRDTFAVTQAQDDPDAPSTSSKTTYAQGMNYTISLPTGTWSLYVTGHLGLRHSAGGGVNARVKIGGVAGSNTSDLAPTTGWVDLFPYSLRTGLDSGPKTIVVEAKSGDTGITSLGNPVLWIMAVRTSLDEP